MDIHARHPDALRVACVRHRFDCARILLLDGEPVGLMKLEKSPGHWRLLQLQLSPGRQGQGIGRTLIEQLLVNADAAGAIVGLSVLKANPARRLYERLGFVQVGEDKFEFRRLWRGFGSGATHRTEPPKEFSMSTADIPRASLHRMVTDEHVCPFGLKSLALLRRKGFAVDDHWLKTREETDAFKQAHSVETTPQTFMQGRRIGGYDDLRRHFGLKVRDPDATRYTPVVAVFVVAALVALAVTWPGGPAAWDGALAILLAERFIATSMCILALLKLQDIEQFSNMFLNYDLLARRVVRYAYVYPFAELLAGVLMLAGLLHWLSVPVALFIGGIGAVSVFKAVYVDKRELKCACVGGGSKVPLGFVSLTENLMMIAMAVWMAFRYGLGV